MKETDFIRNTMRPIKALAGRFWSHKIADAGGLTYSQGRAIDVVACWNGHFIGIEFKLHKSECAFPLAAVRDYQIEQLKEIHAARGTALIFIGVVLGPRRKIVYSIPIDEWLAGTADLKRKSVRLQDDFAKFGHPLPLTVTQWTQRDLINLIGEHKCDARFAKEFE